MTTLADHSPLRSLAHILHAASVVGSGGTAWDRGDQQSKPEASSESTLTSDLHALFALLRERQAPYLLVGGVAMLRYIDGRNTDDIDLIVAVEDAARVPEIVSSPSPSADGERTISSGRPRERAGVREHPVQARFRSVRVDLLFTSNKVFRLTKDRYATMHQFAELAAPCASVEGLVLLKLYALPSLYQQGDMQRAALYETDVLMLCQRHKPDIAPLVQSLRPHIAPGEFEELQRIVSEIQQRMQRMQRMQQRGT